MEEYNALPNPCGVGMRLEPEKLSDGTMLFTVIDTVDGLSADLSGVVNVGDELLEINGIDTSTQSYAQIMALSHGTRGSQVLQGFLAHKKQPPSLGPP